jgi:hypothetical protein
MLAGRRCGAFVRQCTPPSELSYQKLLWAAFIAHAIIGRHAHVITESRELSNRLTRRRIQSERFFASRMTSASGASALGSPASRARF